MKYSRFEDLPVWQQAVRLAEGCEDLIALAKNRISWSKRDQLDRCSLSVSNNIAEGFERGSTNELLAFLYIARGSAGETRSMLAYFERRPALRDLAPEFARLRSLAESCSRQLRAWADSLQNSEIQGQRHLNSLTRDAWKKRQLRESARRSYQEQERQIVKGLPLDHPYRLDYERRHGPLD